MDVIGPRSGRRALILVLGAVLAGLAGVEGTAAAFQLTGTVVDSGGEPVDDVDLDIEDLATGGAIVIPEDNTDGDGRYAIELPPGVYRILFEPPLGLPLAPHIEPRLELAADRVLDVTLPPGIGLAGRVTGPDGSGVAGADLDVWDRALGVKLPTPGDRSNELGFYSVVVPAGTYDLVADPPLATRFASARVDSLVIASEDVIANLRLEPGFVLSGQVRGAGGAPAAGIDLDATDLATGRDAPLAEDKTDAGGRYAVVLRPGSYELGIDAPAATRLVSAVVPELSIDADRLLDVDLVPGFLVEGEVRDPERRLVEGANLDFVDTATGRTVPTPSDFTNVLGAYAVVVPGGTYDLVAWPPAGAAYPPDTTRAVEVSGDRRLDFYFGEDPPPAPPPPPPALALGHPFPNPSPAGATIPFVLPADQGPVAVSIFDAAGRRVRSLALRGRGGEGGPGQLVWDGRDVHGLDVPSGAYFIRLEAAGRSLQAKLIVFRESL